MGVVTTVGVAWGFASLAEQSSYFKVRRTIEGSMLVSEGGTYGLGADRTELRSSALADLFVPETALAADTELNRTKFLSNMAVRFAGGANKQEQGDRGGAQYGEHDPHAASA